MKEKQMQLKRHIERIARENNVTRDDVAEVEESIWGFVKERIQSTNIETEEHSNIYLRFLGTVFISPGRISKVKENIRKKNESTRHNNS